MLGLGLKFSIYVVGELSPEQMSSILESLKLTG